MPKPSDLDLLMAQVAGMQAQLSALEQGAFPAPSEDEPRVVKDLLEGGSGLLLNSKVQFGYKLNPDGDNTAEVRIYAGEIHHGTRAIINVAQTDVVITADQQYVWVQYVFGSGTATIPSPSTSKPVSSDADSTFREWLYLFGLNAGVASMAKVGHFGNIWIAGATG